MPLYFSNQPIHNFLKYLLDRLETEFLITLLNLNRASTDGLKSYYRDKLDAVVSKRLEISARITKNIEISDEARTKYYSDWIYCAAHVITATERYQTVETISKRLRLPHQSVAEALEFLEESGLVKKLSRTYENLSGSVHLKNDGVSIKSHHRNWRARAMESLTTNSPEQMNYSSVITCGQAESVAIRQVFLDTIQKVRAIVKEAPSEEIFCYNLDFFEL